MHDQKETGQLGRTRTRLCCSIGLSRAATSTRTRPGAENHETERRGAWASGLWPLMAATSPLPRLAGPDGRAIMQRMADKAPGRQGGAPGQVRSQVWFR